MNMQIIGPYQTAELDNVHRILTRLGLKQDEQVFILGFLEEVEKQKILSECHVHM